MKLLDKFKNMFVEEIEDEEEPVKKEVIQVKIPSAKPKNVEEILDEDTDTIEEVKEVREHQEEKKEEKFVFPVYFDDKDFEKIEKKTEPVKPVQPIREAYGIKKEEKPERKVFKPTPIISPVYGVLDKNYRKEEITQRKKTPTFEYRSSDEIDIDDVRKKAYGTLEDDLENTLFEKTSILFNNEVEKQKEEKENDDSLIDVFEDTKPKHVDVTVTDTKAVDIKIDNFEDNKEDAKGLLKDLEDTSDNMIALELNKDHTNETRESRYVDELNDSELFNLIDSMYEKKDDE